MITCPSSRFSFVIWSSVPSTVSPPPSVISTTMLSLKLPTSLTPVMLASSLFSICTECVRSLSVLPSIHGLSFILFLLSLLYVFYCRNCGLSADRLRNNTDNSSFPFRNTLNCSLFSREIRNRSPPCVLYTVCMPARHYADTDDSAETFSVLSKRVVL